MPSPFDRLLQQAVKRAETDPAGAFDQLDELYGKSLTDADVRNLSGFAAHLGGAGLGRWPETIAFLRRCLEHDGLDHGKESERSIWRALAVIYTCAGDQEAATDAIAAGVRNEAEHCRVAALTAQTLAARRKLAEAKPHLDQAIELLDQVPDGDEILTQLAMIAGNLGRMAETRFRAARDLLVSATGATDAAMRRLGDVGNRHKALYQRGRALALAGRPAEALVFVQEMMQLEESMQAGPVERFYSAALACRSQIVRGQFRIANQALNACQDFVGQAPESERPGMIGIGKELKTDLEAARSAAGDGG